MNVTQDLDLGLWRPESVWRWRMRRPSLSPHRTEKLNRWPGWLGVAT